MQSPVGMVSVEFGGIKVSLVDARSSPADPSVPRDGTETTTSLSIFGARHMMSSLASSLDFVHLLTLCGSAAPPLTGVAALDGLDLDIRPFLFA